MPTVGEALSRRGITLGLRVVSMMAKDGLLCVGGGMELTWIRHGTPFRSGMDQVWPNLALFQSSL